MNLCLLVWIYSLLSIGTAKTHSLLSDLRNESSIDQYNEGTTEVFNSSSVEYETNPIYCQANVFNLNCSENFKNCSSIYEVATEIYHILENKSLHIPYFENVTKPFGIWDPSDYLLVNHTVYICWSSNSSITHEEVNENNSESKILSLVSLIGLIISFISFFLHFFVFFIVPEVRNLIGKNLFSLTTAIFFGYLFFFIQSFYKDTPVCSIFGLLIYYFFMASFFWMNAIAFDIFRSFKEALSRLRLSSKSSEWKKFICYSIYSWMIPAVSLILIIIGDKTDWLPEEYRPAFNDDKSCWFNNKKALLVFFILPLSLLMIINIIFFVVSVGIIFCNSIHSEEIATSKLRLYLKLAVIMGLVWVTGSIASLADLIPLYYIFIVLSGLQGFFIFFAFIRFKKIKHHLCKKFKRDRVTSDTSLYTVEELRSSQSV